MFILQAQALNILQLLFAIETIVIKDLPAVYYTNTTPKRPAKGFRWRDGASVVRQSSSCSEKGLWKFGKGLPVAVRGFGRSAKQLPQRKRAFESLVKDSGGGTGPQRLLKQTRGEKKRGDHLMLRRPPRQGVSS